MIARTEELKKARKVVADFLEEFSKLEAFKLRDDNGRNLINPEEIIFVKKSLLYIGHLLMFYEGLIK